LAKRVIDKLRQKVIEQMYTISAHANEEMSNDELTSLGVEQAVLTGKIEKRFTTDPRGTRYEVVGQAMDGRPIAVVCRTLATGWLRIITVYALKSEEP
jgi:hypothetical protein